MNTIDFPVCKNVLLTGAGFTHNFGGFLARAMWSEIHNRIHRMGATGLLRLLKSKFNYEELYHEVISGTQYSVKEKDSFVSAMREAYDSLDGVVRNYNRCFKTTTHINLNNLCDFILLFAGQGKAKGFFFTLNQDLFMERYWCGNEKIVFPGIKVNYIRFNIGRDKVLEQSDLAIVPTEKELGERKRDFRNLGRLYYIKLHGSYDWRDVNNQNKMIVGVNKPEYISNEPILSWYFNLFEDVLSFDGSRLLIIGYGFRDPHINKVIADSIANNNLKLYIMCPTDPEDFSNNTLAFSDQYKRTIWNGIAGYYPYSLVDLFPYGHHPTQHYHDFIADFFEK